MVLFFQGDRMINGFEEVTGELCGDELAAAAYLSVLFASGQYTQGHPLTARTMGRILKDRLPGKYPGARIRKIIHHIRIHHNVSGIIASGSGYYTAGSPSEVEAYIVSLRQRIASIAEIVCALREDIRPRQKELFEDIV
jgi:hypothetical protein